MSYYKEDIPFLLEVLHGLKPYLWDGNNAEERFDDKSEFVCCAAELYMLSYMEGEGSLFDKLFKSTLDGHYTLFDKFIKSTLDGHYTFNGWYSEQRGYYPSDKEYQSARHKWVDKMIDDLKRYQKG